MKQVNFSHPGGFPLEQETLERLQTAYRSELYEAIKAHLSIEKGKNYIIAHATDKTRGWAVIHEPTQTGEGILYPIKTGITNNYLKTTKTTTNLTYGDGNSQTAYTDYEAEYVGAAGTPVTSDNEAVNYYDLKDFVIVKNIKSIETDINLINQSYLPLNGSKAMQGDLDLGNYKLSRLDTRENYDASVRATDFNFGSASRRGLKHPEDYLGRALVDSSVMTETSLTLNYDSDWEKTHIGGKVYLDNLNTDIEDFSASESSQNSLLLMDNANQVMKSNDLLNSLLRRITDLEKKPATTVPIGMIAIWGKPAPFPKGWEEYVPLRGRMPVGLNIYDFEFSTLTNKGGSKNKVLTIDEMPSHSHEFRAYIQSGSNDGSGGEAAGYFQDSTTTNVGGGQSFSMLNPYKVVFYIQYTGEPIDLSAPLEPVFLTESRHGQTYVDLNWYAPPNNGRVTNYMIYKNNDLVATVESNVLSYTASGLSRNTMYMFQIVASDILGNISAPSNPVIVRTNGIF